MPKREPKILLFDIETTPNLAWVWGKYQQDVIAFEKDWELLCFAYKWYGRKKVYFERADKYQMTGKSADKKLCERLQELFDEADIIIGHNGDNFDIKKTHARMIHHEYNPPAPAKTIDTLKIAKNRFKFTSNRLDDLGVFLGLGEKINTGGFPLWKGCMAENKKSWNKMEKYNKQDVILLEKIYERFKPWIPNHPNISLLEGGNGCPNCGSINVIRQGLRANHKAVQQQWQCKDCNGWYLTAKSYLTPEEKAEAKITTNASRRKND